jgi:hypothetical protein
MILTWDNKLQAGVMVIENYKIDCHDPTCKGLMVPRVVAKSQTLWYRCEVCGKLEMAGKTKAVKAD